ncbi:MAG: toxic anion resistance protein [Oscillospiraceae bacterium]|nr:toxic anion resistance protein [Oscillospiraceae bacterium]
MNNNLPELKLDNNSADTSMQLSLDESQLTEAERKIIDEFIKKIDLTDSSTIMTYGSSAQRKVADFSDSALNNVRTQDLGEVGGMIINLVNELGMIKIDENQKGLKGMFKRSQNKMNQLKSKYDKAEVSVEKICSALELHQVQLLKDITMLDKLYDVNLINFKEISLYIIAGKKRLNEARDTTLKELLDRANTTKLAQDAQSANDFAALCDRFEKKIYDLELTRMVAIQSAPQIRMVQNNDTVLAEKIQSTIVNTIPLWKSQMIIALGLAHAQDALAAQRKVTDMTNELLRRNAEALKMGTIETAREAERGVVDIETLTFTNSTLIQTLDEVLKITEEGRAKRRAAENELHRMEGELKTKLLEINTKR